MSNTDFVYEPGKIYVSPSQITTFEECQRKWAWKHIEKVEIPPNASAALGTEVHQQLEDYLRDGKPLDFTKVSGEIASSGLHWLPKPKSKGLVLEGHFVFPSGAGFYYQGYRDFLIADSALVPGLPGGAPCVGDHKTTSNISKWAKTKDVLETDVQAMIYAKEGMDHYGADVIDLAWVYYQTGKTRKSDRVHLRVTRDHVNEQFEKIDSTARELVDIKKSGVKALDLPPSPEACEAYGGCPHRFRCNLSPIQMLAAKAKQYQLDTQPFWKGNDMTTTTDSLMDMLAKKRNGKGTVEINPPEFQPPPHPDTTLPALATVAESVEEVVKPKRTRRTKAEMLAATETENTTTASTASTDPAPITENQVVPAEVIQTGPFTPVTMPEVYTITVTAGKELYAPVPYNTVEVGPFTVQGETKPGETIAEGMARLLEVVNSIMDSERMRKNAAFVKGYLEMKKGVEKGT